MLAADSQVLSLRPTSSLRARARRDVSFEAGASGTSDSAGRYFKSLSSRRTYSIETMLSMRTKFALRPANLGDLPCVEAGADDMLTWGLRSTTKTASKQAKAARKERSGATKASRCASAEDKGATETGSSENVVPLQSTENRWRRTQEEGFLTVLRKLKGILNKLTVDKFDSLASKFVDLVAASCHDEEELRSAVQLVFDKALAETNFGDMYPNLCVLLSHKLPAITIRAEDNAHPPRSVTFKSVILSLCQKEFEKAFREIHPDPSISESELEELRLKQRKRMLGNIQFIGELFKKSMVNAKVVLYCARQLSTADPPQSSHLESVCTLLNVVGSVLDKGAKSPRPIVDMSVLNAMYGHLKKLSVSSEVQLRARFIIRDLLDLRDNGWVPRRKKVEAMKIDEFRQKQEPTRALRPERPSPRSHADLFRVDIRGGARVARVGSGGSSTDAGGHRSRRGRRHDRYARALHLTPSTDHLTDQDLASRYEQVGEEKPAERQEPTQEAPVEAPVAPSLSEKEIESKVRNLVSEFIDIRDVKEACECLDEASTADNTFRDIRVTAEVLNQGMDNNKQDERGHAVQLLKEFRNLDKIRADSVEAGILETFEYLSDIVIDLPIAPTRFAEMLVGMVNAGVLRREFLETPSEDACVKKTKEQALQNLSV